MKGEGIARETLEKVAYMSPDGKSFVDHRRAKFAKPAGWKLAKVEYERVTGFMSPRHPRWTEYLHARHRVSLLLTVRLILKLGEGSVPPFEDVVRTLGQGRLGHHVSGRCERRMCTDAYRYLRKLSNRLERLPKKFAPAAQWITERELSEQSSPGGRYDRV